MGELVNLTESTLYQPPDELRAWELVGERLPLDVEFVGKMELVQDFPRQRQVLDAAERLHVHDAHAAVQPQEL